MKKDAILIGFGLVISILFLVAMMAMLFNGT
jgi:hypothetical protein